jgi:GAF domain-containing protein
MNEAIKYYEVAIDSAIEAKNAWMQAWASELQANYWSEQKLKRLATPCYISSFQMWNEWGSAGKVSDLKMKQPLLVTTVSRHISVNTKGRTFSRAKTFKAEKEEQKTMDLDLSTIIKVTNSLSNEKSLTELLKKLMVHLMTNTGATKTVVMLTQGTQLFCNASAYLDQDGKIKHENMNQLVDKDIIPISIVYYVLRSGEHVVHNDTDSTRYDQDEYLDIVSPKSILCCPIKHQDDISGVLYLENKSQQGAFTQGRCQLVESLMSSVSISIANMKLTQLNQELSLKLNTNKKDQAPKFNFDAPITRVLGQLQTLKDRFQQEGESKEIEKLDEIITILNSDSLFTAQFDHVNDENGESLDQDTRSWLQSTLQHRILVESNSAKSSMTNVKLDPDPVPDPSDPTYQYQMTPYADFDMFHYSILTQGKPLYYQCMHMLRKYKIQELLPIPEIQSRSYFQKVELEYHNLPYHNSTHAADLLKTMEALLLDTELASKFSGLEIFGMIVAGAVHDMDHPGVNNQFLVTVHHPISILYNDISVLENHHASRAFDIAICKESNLFSKLKVDQFVLLRKNVIQLVLATDLSQHFQIINKFKQRIQNGLKLEETSDRALCMEMCMKLGDLNNPTKPFALSQKWAMCVMQEFFLQVKNANSG